MDIKKAILISISSLLFFLTSCTQSQKKQVLPKKAKTEINKKEVFTNFDLSNKLYLLAPEFNSKECEAYGECDCCSSNYLFLDNENFVCVDYCLESDTFYSGKYKIENEKIELKYNSTIVQKEYNWENETDTTNTQPKYFYKTEKCKSFQSVWTRFNCKEKICFKNINNETEYASLDKTQTSESFLAELKRDGIWQRLNIK